MSVNLDSELNNFSSPNQTDFQWQDFMDRKDDLYAHAKYEIILGWLERKTIQHQESALVVGCGSGELIGMLLHKGYSVTAFDIDEATVELAKKNLGSLINNVTLTVSRLETFDPGHHFDLVIATDVIEHIEDDNAAVKKLWELTKERGKVIITVPALQFLFGIHDEKLGHYRRYSQSQLSSLTIPYFHSCRSRYFGVFFVPVTWLVSRFLRRNYPLSRKGGVFSSIARSVLKVIFAIEKKLNPSLGTSLLFSGEKVSK